MTWSHGEPKLEREREREVEKERGREVLGEDASSIWSRQSGKKEERDGDEEEVKREGYVE